MGGGEGELKGEFKGWVNVCESKGNLVPRAFSSTIFKMADRREIALAKAGSRGTKSPKILEIFYHATF